jgi:cellulose synthase/poly-beta-1,6-N-acetylglucosamine synthase-like glycosyltransferase
VALSIDRRLGDRLALLAGATTVAGGTWFNWRAWRRDGERFDSSEADPVPPPGAWLARPEISVLVAAWNESATIERLIESFIALPYEPKKLVVCAGGEDDTYDAARRWMGPQVTVLHQVRGEGKQRALQRCLHRATGDVVVLTDADCILTEESLERLVFPLTQIDVAAASGYSEPWPEQQRDVLAQYQWFQDRMRADHGGDRADGIFGRNCAVRRDILEELQPFAMPAATGTDYVLGQAIIRRGGAILAVPASRVWTRYPVTVRTYLRMRRRWIKNILIHAPRFGAWSDLSATVGAIGIAGATLLTPLLAPIAGRRALILPLTLITLASENRIRRIALGARLTGMRPRWSVVAVTPVLTLLDQSAVLLALLDAVIPSRRPNW